MAEAPQQGQGQAAPAGTPSGADGTQVTPQGAPDGFVPQKTVDKLIGSTRTEARDTAITTLLEEVGYESLDDLKNAATEYQGIQEAVTSEAERATQRAEKLEQRAKTAEERYTNTLRDYALRDALRDAGVQSDSLAFVMRGIDKSQLSVDKDGNVSGVEEAVESAQQEAPVLFGGEAGGARQRVNAPQTNGTGVNTPGSSQTPEEMQAAWLAQFIGR